MVGCAQLADANLANALEALRHHFHVRGDDGIAESSELFDILFVDDVPELFLLDSEFLKQWGDGEEGAEERVALHAELEVTAFGGLARDLEARQREHTDVLVENLLSRPER